MSGSRGSTPWAGPVVGVLFIGLAAWFVYGSPPVEIPLTPSIRVSDRLISTTPRRIPLTDPPVVNIGGFARTCMECHRTFPSGKPKSPSDLLQHTNVVLRHGLHVNCLGCHDDQNRDRLVMLSGESLPFGNSPVLCAQCHGRIYEDWSAGMHGRTHGSWKTDSDEQTRLTCLECHDPHDPRHPAMDPVTPLPPPNTLRMGDPSEAHKEHVHDNVLRRHESSEPEEGH